MNDERKVQDLATASEKELMREIQLMTTKIRPVSWGGSKTVTTMDIGKSWIDHEPVYDQLSCAIYNFNNYIHVSPKSEDLGKDYYLEQTRAAIEEFWELNEETFKEKRPKL